MLLTQIISFICVRAHDCHNPTISASTGRRRNMQSWGGWV